MDPKNINQLDPKLKEAYDRVMGVDLSSSQGQPAAPPPPPVQTPPPPPPLGANPLPQTSPPVHDLPPAQNPNIPPPPPPLNPAPEAQEASPPVPERRSPDVFQSFNASNQSEKQEQANPSTSFKPKSKVSTPILVFVGAIFFVIYAILWGKIFGLF